MKQHNIITAKSGRQLRRIRDGVVFTGAIALGMCYTAEGSYQEQASDYEEVVLYRGQYYTANTVGEFVEGLIRRKYSISDELAIQRQRDIKPDEFEAYYQYCEECKTIAHSLLS